MEKELGLKTKKDIENLIPKDKKASIAKFVELCKKRARKYADIQTQQSKRLGYFMDWDNSYYTMSDENNYMIWDFLKVCNDNGWIYKGNDVVAWCPRCETAISQHEMLTEDYKQVTHDSIYLKLPVKKSRDEYLLVWTTTPWTIPANTAVAVDSDLDYVLVEVGPNEKYWIAKDLMIGVIDEGKAKVIKTVKGVKLEGFEYESPFDSLPVVAQALRKYPTKMHKVILTDKLLMPITTDEGTGLVHTSTSTGEEDHRLGEKLGLPTTPAINDRAEYLKGFGKFEGKNAKKHPELIIDYLKENKVNGSPWIYKVVPYAHRYPVCWRCKTELVWKVTDEWYIAMDKPLKDKSTLRQRMIKVAKKIKWIPSFGLERELDWLNNMHDWLISKKNRYWGLALPIWECPKCGEFEVIGGKEELKKRAVSGWSEFEGKSPHKPQIDDVKIKCSKCGEIASRIEPVGNPWLDAGIVSFSTIKKDNKGKPLYLADKSEWKKWFPADFITESFPGQFKNWFYSLIAMSTALENREAFREVLGFAELLGEDGSPMHKSKGNLIEFNNAADKIGVDVLRWMYATQNPSENLLFGYKVADEVRRRFHIKLWNIYNFFVTYANLDNWEPNKDDKVIDISRDNILDKWILARFVQTQQKVTKSINKYDAYSASFEIEAFVEDFSNWYIRRSRERVGPAAVNKKDKEDFYQTTYYLLLTLSKILAIFTPFMADNIYSNLTKGKSVHLADWPEELVEIDEGEKLIDDMRMIRSIVERIHSARKEAKIAVRQPLASATLVGETINISDVDEKLLGLAKEELNVKSIKSEKGKEGVVLDTTITPELEEEAKARELVRRIQTARKELGFDLGQKSKVVSPWIPSDRNLLERVKSRSLTSVLKYGDKFEVKVDNGK